VLSCKVVDPKILLERVGATLESTSTGGVDPEGLLVLPAGDLRALRGSVECCRFSYSLRQLVALLGHHWEVLP
jgi:hypothetical protein